MDENTRISWENNHLPLDEHQKKEMILNLKKLLRDVRHTIRSIRIDSSDCPCLCCGKNLVILTIKYSVNLKIPAEIFTQDTIQCSFCPTCKDYRYLTPFLTAIQLLSHTL